MHEHEHRRVVRAVLVHLDLTLRNSNAHRSPPMRRTWAPSRRAAITSDVMEARTSRGYGAFDGESAIRRADAHVASIAQAEPARSRDVGVGLGATSVLSRDR